MGLTARERRRQALRVRVTVLISEDDLEAFEEETRRRFAQKVSMGLSRDEADKLVTRSKVLTRALRAGLELLRRDDEPEDG